MLHRSSDFPDSHALAKMFRNFEEREGHPFQRMKCRMSSFAYQPQKDTDGEMILCEQIEFLDLRSFLYYDFWNGLRLNHLPTKCGLCGKYFLLEGGKYNRYCTNPLPDEPDKTYRETGSKRKHDDRCKTDPFWQTYNRAYKAHYARYMKKKMTAEDFDAWKRMASELRDRAVQDLISYEKYVREIKRELVISLSRSTELIRTPPPSPTTRRGCRQASRQDGGCRRNRCNPPPTTISEDFISSTRSASESTRLIQTPNSAETAPSRAASAPFLFICRSAARARRASSPVSPRRIR